MLFAFSGILALLCANHFYQKYLQHIFFFTAASRPAESLTVSPFTRNPFTHF
jgi:hypothetical protein